jgi:transcription initiation factor TFIIIB Brf1 subunit/transcription initiation factor TFIIB
MNLEEKFLDMTDDEIDNLLFGINLPKKIINKNECISCGSNKLILDNTKGYKVCEDCSVVNEEYFEKNQEFSNEPTSAHYGCPTNPFFPKSALGTKINSSHYNRLSALQRQCQMPYREKSLLEVLERIQEKCKKYFISQTIIDSAKIYYKRISDSKHTKGKRKNKNIIMRCINRRSMIAACLFYACKSQKELRSPKEIADIYDLEIKHVNRGCRKFTEILPLSTIFVEVKNSESLDFIERFAKILNIDNEYITIAKSISINIHKLDIASTHEPPSVAAGCLLLVSNIYHLNLNKKEISEIFGISDVTISKTYRKIYPFHKIITNNQVTDMIIQRNNNNNKTSNITEEHLIFKDDNSTENNSTEDILTENNSTENNSSEDILTEDNSIEDTIINKKYKLQKNKLEKNKTISIEL